MLELESVVEPQVTAGAVTAVPAVTVAGDGLPQASFGLTVNEPQLAVLLLPPQFAVAETVYVLAVGLFHVGAPAQVMPVVTVVLPHLTVGCVIAVPATPVGAKPVQASWSVDGAAVTVNVPQLTVLFPPQFAVAETL
jgi:hypothetical protein